jgi:hypothetical protein
VTAKVVRNICIGSQRTSPTIEPQQSIESESTSRTCSRIVFYKKATQKSSFFFFTLSVSSSSSSSFASSQRPANELFIMHKATEILIAFCSNVARHVTHNKCCWPSSIAQSTVSQGRANSSSRSFIFGRPFSPTLSMSNRLIPFSSSD